MPAEPKFSLGVVILAAGRSSRMGRPKMLLPWGNSTVISHQIELWSGLPASQIVVVCAADDLGMKSELDRLQFPAANRVLNPNPAQGMFSSVQCAAQWPGWEPTLTHFAIALGDQPHLQPATLRALIEFARQHPEKICQPSHRGHARHPVMAPMAVFKSLAETGAHSLKDFLENNLQAVEYITVNDPGLALDIDEPSDYQAALKLSQVS